jgi:hypothetical protein
MYHYYEPQYDLSFASGLSVQHYFLTGDITVPTSQQYNVMRMEGDVIGYNTVDSKFKGIYWQYTAHDIRDAYCAIGLITNTGEGNTKAIYGRAQASTGCTGVVVGLVAGITLDTGVTVNTACAVQASIEGAGTGSEVIGYWLSTAETTKEIEYGFLASHKLGFSGAAFKGFQIGGATGDAFEWTDSVNNLFKVDYNGNIWLGDETNSQRSVYLYSSARSWALQAVDTGDYFRILIGSSGNGLILDSNRNLGVGGLNSFGGGEGGCVCIPNASVNPSTDPTGGGILYCSAGTLYFRTSSGNVRTVAAV